MTLAKLTITPRTRTGDIQPGLRLRIKNVETGLYVLDTADGSLVDSGVGPYVSADDVESFVFTAYSGETPTVISGYENVPFSSGLVSVAVGDYGAVGDGVTDDKAAIQSALTAASGGILNLQNKVYAISGKLTIPANTMVNGNGAQLLLTEDLDTYEGVIDNYGASGGRDHIKIVNLTINGDGHVDDTGGSFKFGQCDYVSLIGCRAIEAGFYIVDSSHVRVIDWDGDNSGGSVGAEVVDIKDVTISNFTMTSTALTDRGPSLLIRAFNGYAVESVTITNVKSDGCRKSPLKISISSGETGSISDVAVNGVVVSNWSTGDGASYSGDGIEVFGQSGSPLSRISISNAVVKAGGNAGEQNGVRMAYVNDFSITGVCVEGVERAGILVDSCTNGVISGCNLNGCGTDADAVYCGGIYLYQSSRVTVVGNNTINSPNSYSGIAVTACGECLVSGNNTDNNGGYGIRESGANTAANTYGVNKTEGNTLGGQSLAGTAYSSYINPRVLKFSASITGGNVLANEMVTGNLTTSATGAETGDRVFMAPSGSPGTGFVWSANVYNTGRINYVIANCDGTSTRSLATLTWTAYVFKE